MRDVHEQVENMLEGSFIKEEIQKEPETPQSIKLPVALLAVGYQFTTLLKSGDMCFSRWS